MTNYTQSVGRPREFDELKVLKIIMELFWRQGYEGTGLCDLIESTGLARGSLYKAFGSKRNMYLEALSTYETLYVDAASSALLDHRSPKVRITEFLSAPINNTNQASERKGCFLCNASADRADLDDDIRLLVQRGFVKLNKALKSAISELNTDASPEVLRDQSEAMLAIYSGLSIMARSGISQERMIAARNGGLLSLEAKDSIRT